MVSGCRYDAAGWWKVVVGSGGGGWWREVDALWWFKGVQSGSRWFKVVHGGY